MTLAFSLLLLFIALLFFSIARINRGHIPFLRNIAAFDVIKGSNSRAVESGKPLHLSLGVGSMTNATTADSLVGLSVLNYMAQQAAITNNHPIVSMADPTVMLFAQNVLRAAYQEDNPTALVEAYHNVQWIAPQPTAYAAGVMTLIGKDNVDTNITLGNFGDEYLLIGEVAARRNGANVAGTSQPNTLPFMYASAQETLLGEEIYAAGAYLQKQPAHLASLITQDTMRWVIFGIIFVGIIATSLR